MERQMSLASTCTDDIKAGGCEKNGKSNNMDDLLSLYTYKQEKRRIGEKKGDFRCETCDSHFVYKSSLKKHVKSVHEGLIYSCDQCKFEAKQQRTLLGHKQTIHKGVKYLCDHCNFKSTNQEYLKLHRKTKHGIPSLVSCKQCAYQTINIS